MFDDLMEMEDKIFEGTKYYPYPARELLKYIFYLDAGEPEE